MNKHTKKVLDRLDGVQQSGDGWKACCPAHEDRVPSLTVSEGNDGKVLLKCHAGCSFEEVVSALGLKPKDLFPGGNAKSNGRKEVVATYPYHDASGEVLFEVVRSQPKGFGQRAYLPGHPDAGKRGCPDGFVWGRSKHGIDSVLYRLPAVLEATGEGRVVFVVEGEKDVATLERWGFTATCNPQGAGSWQESYSKDLKGARVVILPDSDEEGKRHAREVARSALGYALDVRIIELPGLPEKGDVSDWAAAGGTAEKLRQLAEEAPALEGPPEVEAEAEKPGAPLEIGVLASEVERLAVRWLWEGRLALGEMTILDGDPGLGKSTLLCDLAARITTGRPLPGDGGLVPAAAEAAGGVVIVTGEDSIAHTIRPRLEAAGADLSRCLIVQHVPDENENPRPAVIPSDLDKLRYATESVEARLLIIDPLMAHLPGKLNAHRDQDVRAALTLLAGFAREAECAVVVVRHLNKMQGASPLYRGGGSIGIIGAFRIGLLMGEDPEAEDRLVLASNKNNLAPKPPSLGLRLEESPDVEGVARVRWEGCVSYSALDLLQPKDKGRSSPERNRAEAFLKEFLSEGPRLSTDVYEAMEEAGIKKRTLLRAKEGLGIESEQIKPGSRRWYYVPPWTGETPEGKDATKEDGNLLNGNLSAEGKPRSEHLNGDLKGGKRKDAGKVASSEGNGLLSPEAQHSAPTLFGNGRFDAGTDSSDAEDESTNASGSERSPIAGALLEAPTVRWAFPPITDEWLAHRERSDPLHSGGTDASSPAAAMGGGSSIM